MLKRHWWVGILLWMFIGSAVAQQSVLLAPALKKGDTVGLISSGFRVDSAGSVKGAEKYLEQLGLKSIVGKAVLSRDGYFPGTDQARADDINAMFANPDVKAIFELRGGWGSARLLSLIDYDNIRKNPKIIIGYSDITSLLIAINHETGLTTFHGPMPGVSTYWSAYSANNMRRMLFDAKPMVLKNPADSPITTITPGIASGRLIGGNLTVLTSMIGSSYLASDWQGKILFLEDTHEDAYKIDRMLTQLELAGITKQVSGIVFGSCSHCTRLVPASPSVLNVIEQHLKGLGVPTWYGAKFGHQAKMYTVPLGARVKIDASNGTIELLEPVVTEQQ